MRLFFVLALILALLVTIFAVQNNANTDIAFLFWSVAGSQALVLMITLTLGIVIGVLLMLPGTVRRRLEVADLRRKLRTLEGRAISSAAVDRAKEPTESEPAGRTPPPAG